ncbi:MAG: PHP domain-containing protein [Oscillospiraceae bacterium]|jgi:hypothetical protein|nr:PHP domain-containing protein [Oscillospiraceae bacterium]
MSYLYETHLHTAQGSACGQANGREMARFYHSLGFSGIMVTDHFFGGNTAVPRALPWKERVDWFCRGYEEAREEGERIGLDVFFGWEQGYLGDEYLIYGLDKQWLLAHPEVEHWTRREQLLGVHKAGGCVIQAHPFRTRDYIRYVRLGLDYADGVEVANAGNLPHNDAYAYRYAKEYELVMTAGSDAHCAASGGEDRIMGVVLEKKLGSIHDYVSLIRHRGRIGLNVSPKRFERAEGAPHIETFYLDENEEPVATGRDWLYE